MFFRPIQALLIKDQPGFHLFQGLGTDAFHVEQVLCLGVGAASLDAGGDVWADFGQGGELLDGGGVGIDRAGGWISPQEDEAHDQEAEHDDADEQQSLGAFPRLDLLLALFDELIEDLAHAGWYGLRGVFSQPEKRPLSWSSSGLL